MDLFDSAMYGQLLIAANVIRGAYFEGIGGQTLQPVARKHLFLAWHAIREAELSSYDWFVKQEARTKRFRREKEAAHPAKKNHS